MKRFLCIFVTLAMLCGVLAACGGSGNGGDETTTPTPSNHETTTPADNGGETTTGEEETTTQAPNPIETFVPVLRFVVGSDTHLANTATAEDQRLVKLFQSAYAYSDAHEDYTKLDGIFIVGDCVDKGTQEAMDRYFDIVEDNVREGTFTFSTLGNHEFYTTKYYDGWTVAEVYAETVRMFTEASGQEDVDLHTTIGGYHFIFLSPDTAHGWNFSTAKAQWLAQQLAAASADDPTGRKPIFVFQHEPPLDTMYGSISTASVSSLKRPRRFFEGKVSSSVQKLSSSSSLVIFFSSRSLIFLPPLIIVYLFIVAQSTQFVNTKAKTLENQTSIPKAFGIYSITVTVTS